MELIKEFHPANNVQIFNTALNVVSVIGLGMLLHMWIALRRRNSKVYDNINKRLDQILLLSNEVYQTSKKQPHRIIRIKHPPLDQ